MLLASLKHGEQSVQWQSALRTLDELIWSVGLQSDTEAGRHLLERLPGLLKALRDGLTSAAFDPFSTREFYVRLQVLHVQPLTGVEVLSVVREPFTFGAEVPDTAQDLPGDDPDLISALQMRIGDWVEFQQGNDAALRCKLTAIVAPANRYIFINHTGLKVLEQNLGELAQAFKRGDLRRLDDGLLFDRALLPGLRAEEGRQGQGLLPLVWDLLARAQNPGFAETALGHRPQAPDLAPDLPQVIDALLARAPEAAGPLAGWLAREARRLAPGPRAALLSAVQNASPAAQRGAGAQGAAQSVQGVTLPGQITPETVQLMTVFCADDPRPA